jgi:CheY-like chemotaxis protein
MPHRLLLADDSVTVQRVIELTFAEEGIHVVSVSDGHAAIAKLTAERFDIVLADVAMPGRDGFEVAAFVRARPELSDVPVVLLSGAFDPVDQVRVAEAGAAAVLVKPFEPQMVIATVRELLGGEHARPAPSPADTPAARPSSSADDYFDRLDRAFASLNPSLEPRTTRMPAGGPEPVPPPTPSGGDGGEDGAASPAGAAARLPAAAGSSPPASTPPRAGDAALADTFATLLAVEQGELPPSALLAPSLAEDDEIVDRIARRVVEQLSDRAVREMAADIVSRTAERLVREEIERIRQDDSHA